MIESCENILARPDVNGAPDQMQGFALIQFSDNMTFHLGGEAVRERFKRISKSMLNGCYYPDEIIRFEGAFRQECRDLRVGDRVLQLAKLPFLFGYRTKTVVEISDAVLDPRSCKIGYFTTTKHFAKGWWSAELRIEDDELVLRVSCVARPASLLYWMFIPIARGLQLRAMHAAIRRFSSWV